VPNPATILSILSSCPKQHPLLSPTENGQACLAGVTFSDNGTKPYPCRWMTEDDSRRGAETRRNLDFQSPSSSHPSVIPLTTWNRQFIYPQMVPIAQIEGQRREHPTLVDC
jgi:hypothetical protein